MICIPIKKKTIESLLNDLKKVQKKADIIEIWFDELGKNLNKSIINKVFSTTNKKLIYKCTNIGNLALVLAAKPAFIDLDLKTKVSTLQKIKKLSPKTILILSHHDFKKTPTDKSLKSIAQKAIIKKADIIKIATFANTFSDSLRMLSILDYLNQKKKNAICISMGDKGRITRLTGHLFGNYLMFVSLDDASKTAPGQLTHQELKKVQTLIQ